MLMLINQPKPEPFAPYAMGRSITRIPAPLSHSSGDNVSAIASCPRHSIWKNNDPLDIQADETDYSNSKIKSHLVSNTKLDSFPRIHIIWTLHNLRNLLK